MEYNTTRKRLIIAEYGRNLQSLVEQVCKMEDRDQRSRAAKALVNVMAQLNPSQRDYVDYRRKLWDHLYIMSDFKLDVDGPYDPPSPNTVHPKPQRLSYAGNKIRYSHYGRIIEKMIDVVSEYPENKEKEVLAPMIANYLKKSYLTWNLDSVTDDVIIKQMNVMSKGRIAMDNSQPLWVANDLVIDPSPGSKKNQKRKSIKHKNFRRK